MVIRIEHCNNIRSGDITIDEGCINIKYAINGTGKSTIAKAIKCKAENDDDGLKKLTHYNNVGIAEDDHHPSVSGLEDITNVMVFDEEFVKNVVFIESDDELLEKSFDVFIKTQRYDDLLSEIEGLIGNVQAMFNEGTDAQILLSDLDKFIELFGKSAAGLATNSALARGLSLGNKVINIPQGLEDYTEFLQDENKLKWLKWQLSGQNYMNHNDKCPFCTGDLTPQRDKIAHLKEEYDVKKLEHLTTILDLFDHFGRYFCDETNQHVQDITSNEQGLSPEQSAYLLSVKSQVELLNDKLKNIQQMGFFSLRAVDGWDTVIRDYKIDVQFLTHLSSAVTTDILNAINTAIEQILPVVGRLQGAVRQQNIEIRTSIDNYQAQIDEFLHNAGYEYTVSFSETPDHLYKLKLKYGGDAQPINRVRSHLSFGERNAFALVLFMYHALHKNAEIIVLDDPISSFDKNKKYAILDKLFRNQDALRGKTVLMMTHDFEPLVDIIYNHSDIFGEVSKAAFLENDNGTIREIGISRENIISSVKVARDNIENRQNIICKLIYLRRLTEIQAGKTDVWNLLSSLFKKRVAPTWGIGEDAPGMNETEISAAEDKIREHIPEFVSYDRLFQLVSDNGEMKRLYTESRSAYEKLQIYRIIFGATGETPVLRKFINETYHIEND